MPVLELSDHLYEQLMSCAESEGITVEQWLSQQVQSPNRSRPTPEANSNQTVALRAADVVPYMVYAYDIGLGHNTYVNKYTKDFFGLTLAEIQAKGNQLFVETLHPDDLARLVEVHDDWHTTPPGTVLQKEYRIRNTAGEYRWLRNYETVLSRSPDGQPLEIIGTAIDITEQRHTGDALRESEARYRTIVENFPNGLIALYDHDLRYTLMNGEGLDQINMTPADFEGKRLRDIYPDIYERDEPALLAALAGKRIEVEVPFGGDIFRVITLPVRDESGTIISGMVMSQNITDLKKAEARQEDLIDQLELAIKGLAASEARYKALFEGSLQPIVVYDEESRFVMLNQIAATGLNSTPEEVIGKRLGDYFPDNHDLNVERIRQVLETGKPMFVEDTFKVGEVERWYWSVVQPLSTEILRGAQIITLDVTERINAQRLREERTQLAADLEKHQALAELRYKLLSVISHEFRTPMAIMLNNSEILSHYDDRLDEQKRQKKLENIVEQVHNLNQMLDEIGKLSQSDHSFLSYDPAPTDICALCETISDEMRDTLSENQDLVLELDPKDDYAVLDKKLIHHALTNLVGNAIKYTPDGGNIRLAVKQTEHHWQFVVEDTGMGIPEADQADLFKPFSRAGNVGEIKGSGLGLSIVQEIAEHHGGRVHFTSQLGVGSTFTIVIPHK